MCFYAFLKDNHCSHVESRMYFESAIVFASDSFTLCIIRSECDYENGNVAIVLELIHCTFLLPKRKKMIL